MKQYLILGGHFLCQMLFPIEKGENGCAHIYRHKISGTLVWLTKGEKETNKMGNKQGMRCTESGLLHLL